MCCHEKFIRSFLFLILVQCVGFIMALSLLFFSSIFYLIINTLKSILIPNSVMQWLVLIKDSSDCISETSFELIIKWHVSVFPLNSLTENYGNFLSGEFCKWPITSTMFLSAWWMVLINISVTRGIRTSTDSCGTTKIISHF